MAEQSQVHYEHMPPFQDVPDDQNSFYEDPKVVAALRKINPVMNPLNNRKWATIDWIKYWIWFPLEWTLTFIMCILGMFLATYGWIKLKSTAKYKPNFFKDTKQVKRQRSDAGITDKRRVSIVIAMFNESDDIEYTLLTVEKNCLHKDNVEIILVDGGSTDNTLECVERVKPLITMPMKVITTDENTSGRGVCQNIGAQAAKHEILIFLHADTVVCKGFDMSARDACEDPKMIIGSWEFTVNRATMPRPLIGMGCMEFFARIRNHFFWVPYGDQGYFVTRTMFDELGGFPSVVFMEDFELTATARRFAVETGGRIHIDPMEAYCSPRRWFKNGVARNTLWNQIVVFCYTQLNYSPEQIYSMYYGKPVPNAKANSDSKKKQ